MLSARLVPATTRGRLAGAVLVLLAGLGLGFPGVSESRPRDKDNDGLSNRHEVHRSHTNPLRADTDGDGLRDAFELRRSHTNPRRRDTDEDGLGDGVEVHQLLTDPRRVDTDRDGLTDVNEVRQFRTDPRKKDSDGDGSSDALELLVNSDPRRRGKKPRLVVPPPTEPVPPPAPSDPVPPADTKAPETTIGSGPSGTVTSDAASFDLSSSEAGSTFQCRLDGGVWSACASPKAYSGLGSGAHNFEARATDAAGNTDASPASRAWTVSAPPDTTAPNTSITAGPTGTTASASASLGFESTEAGSSFECRLDAGAWGACSSPKAYTGLANGSHSFEVRATDAAGNTDASAASRTWTVNVPPADTTAPQTTIDSGPSGTVATSSASLAFSSSESGSTFQCRLDGGGWGSCSSPKAYTGLANGPHTFEVRATDPAGNTDASPASRAWTVDVPAPDTTAPETTIDSGPSGTVAVSSASFTFTSSESASAFQCRLDSGAWGSCSSPKAYSALANGSHTFEVRATDAASNVDASPAARTWTVNVPAPPPPAGGVIRVAPGGDLSAAYNQASAGGVIELLTGNYGAWDTPAGSKQITVRAGEGQRPVLRRLHAKGSNITFDGLDVDAGGGVPMCGSGGSCAAYEVWGDLSNVVFKNGRIGNVGGQKGAFLHGSSDPAPKGVVIENTEIHDVRLTSAGQHLECVMSHTPGVTFRGNIFRNCETFDISLGLGDWWGQPQYGNVTLVNNVFGHATNGSGWHSQGLAWWLTSLDGARVVNNTFENPVLMDRATRGTNGVWANNIGGGWMCVSGVTYAGNVGKSCGASDKQISPASSCGPPACASMLTAPMGWSNPSTFDFHLTVGSPAINAGSAVHAPALDKDGKARAGAPDAGAYEF